MDKRKRQQVISRLKNYYKARFKKLLKKIHIKQYLNFNCIDKNVKKITNNGNRCYNIKKDLMQQQEFSQNSLLRINQVQFSNYLNNFDLSKFNKPLIIKVSEPLKFTYPEKLIIRVSKNNLRKKNPHLNTINNFSEQDQIDEISCSKEDDDDNVIYLQVSKQQFLRQNQPHQLRSEKQKQKLRYIQQQHRYQQFNQLPPSKANKKNVITANPNKKPQFPISNSPKLKSKQQNQQFSISVPQMQLSKLNYQLPLFVKQYFQTKKNSLYAVNLWHYKTHTMTKLHYDCHDNFLFQIQGTKIVTLKPPNNFNTIVKQIKEQKHHKQKQLKNTQKQLKDKKYSYQNQGYQYTTCKSVFSINSNHQNQIFDKEQIENQNENKQKSHLKIALLENECLFIPRGWFHEVESLVSEKGNNIAVNFWGNTIPVYNLPEQQAEINLKQLIFRVAENVCSMQISQWDTLEQSVKIQFRKAYFYKYLQTLST